MKKLKLVFPFFKLMVTEPGVITKALYHAVVNADRKKYVEKKFGLMKGLVQLDLLTLFPEFHEIVSPFTHLYGTSLPIDIAILKLLAKRFDQCDYFEIGTWRGESIANLSEVASRCVSLSLSDKEMEKIGWGGKFVQVQRFFSKDINNIEHIEGNSRTYDFARLGEFDLIFVDGDHSYDGVKNDTEKVFSLLRNENSIVVWHDYTTQYEHINWEVLAGILDGTPSEKRHRIYHISNSLCAIYINGDFKLRRLEYPTIPDKTFRIEISAKKI